MWTPWRSMWRTWKFHKDNEAAWRELREKSQLLAESNKELAKAITSLQSTVRRRHGGHNRWES